MMDRITGTDFPMNSESGRPPDEPGSTHAKKAHRQWWLIVGYLAAGFLYLAIGLVGSWFATGRPLMNYAEMQTWEETPCWILESRIIRADTSDGYSYEVRIEYTPVRDGEKSGYQRPHTSTIRANGHEHANELTARYAPEKQTVCYVNPRRHWESALVIHLPWSALFACVVGLGFLVMAISLIWTAVSLMRGRTGSRDLFQDGYPFERRSDACSSPGGGSRQIPAGLPFFRLKSSTPQQAFPETPLVFSTLWNVILLVLLGPVTSDMKIAGTTFTWFPLIFVLVGIGLFIWLWRGVLASLNPVVEIFVNQPWAQVGQSSEVTWLLSGSISDVRHLTLRLACVSETEDDLGTSTVTHRETLFQKTIVQAAAGTKVAHGRASFTVPASQPATLMGEKNRIIWLIQVHGIVDRRPNIDVAFPITVTG